MIFNFILSSTKGIDEKLGMMDIFVGEMRMFRYMCEYVRSDIKDLHERRYERLTMDET